MCSRVPRTPQVIPAPDLCHASEPQHEVVKMAFTEDIAPTDTIISCSCFLTCPKRSSHQNLHPQDLVPWRRAVKGGMRDSQKDYHRRKPLSLNLDISQGDLLQRVPSPFCLLGISVFITWGDITCLQCNSLCSSNRRAWVVIKQKQSPEVVLGKYVMM